MSDPEIDTLLGRFVVTYSGTRRGLLASPDPITINGRAYRIVTHWHIHESSGNLVISPLGLSTHGTWAQGARGNWYKEATRELTRVVEPHIRRLLAEEEDRGQTAAGTR